MHIMFEPTGSINGLQQAITAMLADHKPASLCLFACDANHFTPQNVDPILKTISRPVFGGVFPAIIHGPQKLETGTLVLGLEDSVDYQIVPGLSKPDIDYEQLIDDKFCSAAPVPTMLTFVDGLAQRIGSFIEALFNVFGLDLNYIGGGAGSLSLESKPCLFTNQGLIGDAALLAPLNRKSGVGVCHGWQSISGPYRVTESDRNVIKTLNWQPAFEVYRQAVEPHARRNFDETDFFDIAKAYPFGIAKMEAERVVRDPLMLGDQNTLICVGEVPEGSFVDILNSQPDDLIDAAGKALARSRNAYGDTRDNTIGLFIDCISRVLFLGTRFEEEIAAVHGEDRPLIGACTIGEIANSGNDYLEFFNKTSVVAILEDQ